MEKAVHSLQKRKENKRGNRKKNGIIMIIMTIMIMIMSRNANDGND